MDNIAKYKSWADALLYQSLDKIPGNELQKQRPMLFGNILALLNHVYAMDVVWRANLEGHAHNMETRNPKNVPAFADLRVKQQNINTWYEKYTEQLTDIELKESVDFTFIGGTAGKMQRIDILNHVVNHASYHRGHIEGVMYQMSIEPPTTDIPVFLQVQDS